MKHDCEIKHSCDDYKTLSNACYTCPKYEHIKKDCIHYHYKDSECTVFDHRTLANCKECKLYEPEKK